MKKAIFLTALAVFLWSTSNTALAAETSGSSESKNQGFFESFIGKVKGFFSGSVEASYERKEELGEARSELLKLMGKYELVLRSGAVKGRDLYLQKDWILGRVSEFRNTIEQSSLSEDSKKRIVFRLDEISKILNMDLVDSPQDKIIPAIIDALNEFESMVFEISEEDAAVILSALEAFLIKI